MKDSPLLAGRWGEFTGHLLGLGDIIGSRESGHQGGEIQLIPPLTRGWVLWERKTHCSSAVLVWTLEGQGRGSHIQGMSRRWVGTSVSLTIDGALFRVLLRLPFLQQPTYLHLQDLASSCLFLKCPTPLQLQQVSSSMRLAQASLLHLGPLAVSHLCKSTHVHSPQACNLPPLTLSPSLTDKLLEGNVKTVSSLLFISMAGVHQLP